MKIIIKMFYMFEKNRSLGEFDSVWIEDRLCWSIGPTVSRTELPLLTNYHLLLQAKV